MTRFDNWRAGLVKAANNRPSLRKGAVTTGERDSINPGQCEPLLDRLSIDGWTYVVRARVCSRMVGS